jgi:hypothetical protein
MRKRDLLVSSNHRTHHLLSHRSQRHRSQRHRSQRHWSQSQHPIIMTIHRLMIPLVRKKMGRTLAKWMRNNPLPFAAGFSLWEADNF